MKKTLKIYRLLTEVREDLTQLVKPVVIQDIRTELSKIDEVLEILEDED